MNSGSGYYCTSSKPFPRFPRHGRIDLTYRCNNRCRHCWLSLPANSPLKQDEISADAIFRIADEARRMGCNEWSISGGEPMLRPDFPEIFDFLTRKAVSYTLNTNGALITPQTAKLLTRRGNKMVALYGADEKTHDGITRHSGSFEGFLRGCSYLREAGARFTVQVVPMRDNYHQLNDMMRLAESLSPSRRIGATWLYLSGNGRGRRDREIIRQRLSAREIIEIDPTIPGPETLSSACATDLHSVFDRGKIDRLFHSCILERQEFHIDPYGTMSFCMYIRDPELRFDLKRWSFATIWDELLPPLAERIRGGEEYRRNCASCRRSNLCQWCPAYAYLEKGRFSAPVKSLCQIAKEREGEASFWLKHRRRYFDLAGMTIQVDSDLPFGENAFGKRFAPFLVLEPGDDVLHVHHHFALPDLSAIKNIKPVYKKKPWEIYRLDSSWIYVGIGPRMDHSRVRSVAVFNDAHTRVRVYHKDEGISRLGNWATLTTFPSDQIMLSRVLADRQGCFMHSAGLVLNGQGILFIGPSGAGKSTVVKLFGKYGDVLCDDRMIVRRWPSGFFIHGSWGHGEIPQVSSARAPLRAILFLEKSKKNHLIPVAEKRQILHLLLFRVVRPLVTTDWWDKTLTLLSALSETVPAYRFQFTKNTCEPRVLEELVGTLDSKSLGESEGNKNVGYREDRPLGRKKAMKA